MLHQSPDLEPEAGIGTVTPRLEQGLKISLQFEVFVTTKNILDEVYIIFPKIQKHEQISQNGQIVEKIKTKIKY